MLRWFSSKVAVESLQEIGRLISASNVNCEVDDLPGDAIEYDLTSIRKHFEENAWDQVLAKGTFREEIVIFLKKKCLSDVLISAVTK